LKSYYRTKINTYFSCHHSIVVSRATWLYLGHSIALRVDSSCHRTSSAVAVNCRKTTTVMTAEEYGKDDDRQHRSTVAAGSTGVRLKQCFLYGFLIWYRFRAMPDWFFPYSSFVLQSLLSAADNHRLCSRAKVTRPPPPVKHTRARPSLSPTDRVKPTTERNGKRWPADEVTCTAWGPVAVACRALVTVRSATAFVATLAHKVGDKTVCRSAVTGEGLKVLSRVAPMQAPVHHRP